MENMKPPAQPSFGVRFVALWVLPVVAVGLLFQIHRWDYQQIHVLLTAGDCSIESAMDGEEPHSFDTLTPDQRLILKGDTTRKSDVEREKAIWEKWPTNIVYLHNYVTRIAGSSEYRREAETHWRDDYAREITKLQPLDPDNARWDYLLADNLLAQSIKDQYSVTNADGSVTNGWAMQVLDRTKLDQAMAHFKTGLGKPMFRRYTREMQVERLAIMGEPTTFLKQIAEIGMAAGMMLPDVSSLRHLSRVSMAYVNLLTKEGRTKEAGEFLMAYRRYVPQINDDTFTLIDALVAGAVAGINADKMPAAFSKLGDDATAKQVRIETEALVQPINDFRKRQKEFRDHSVWWEDISRHSGMLAELMVPSLGECPSVADLTPSRLAEYAVIERGTLGAISGCMEVMLMVCVVLALYYRLMSKATPRPILLLPSATEWGRLLLWGLLIPVLCYYGVTRWAPWCNRSLSPSIEYPQLISQSLALLLVIVAVIFTIVIGRVRRGCSELMLPVAPVVPLPWRAWGCVLVGVPMVLGILPEGMLTLEDIPGHHWSAYLPPVMGGALILSGLAYLIHGIIWRQWFRKDYAAYYGSLMRALIPVMALTVIVLNSVAYPYLRWEERHWITSDTLVRIDPNGSFTVVEARVTHRLKTEVQQAAAKFPEICRRPVR